MKLLKDFFNNNFYFWLLGISFTLISYISIHQSLVENKTYSLIPVFFVKFCLYFLIGQIVKGLTLGKVDLNMQEEVNMQEDLKMMSFTAKDL